MRNASFAFGILTQNSNLAHHLFFQTLSEINIKGFEKCRIY